MTMEYRKEQSGKEITLWDDANGIGLRFTEGEPADNDFIFTGKWEIGAATLLASEKLTLYAREAYPLEFAKVRTETEARDRYNNVLLRIMGGGYKLERNGKIITLWDEAHEVGLRFTEGEKLQAYASTLIVSKWEMTSTEEGIKLLSEISGKLRKAAAKIYPEEFEELK